MKALTVCQPYAHLICLPETDPRRKRVENRTWETSYRGLFYLHAGKSRAWLSNGPRTEFDSAYGIPVSEMAFGAVIAVVRLVDCLPIEEIRAGKHDARHPWLRSHEHTEGPWCWVLDDKPAPIGPWPYRGALGLFDIQDAELDRVANAVLSTARMDVPTCPKVPPCANWSKCDPWDCPHATTHNYGDKLGE